MAERFLFDTDVLIENLREQVEAVAYLENLTEPLLVSAVTVAELYSGVRDGDERAKLDAFVSAFEVARVDREIALKGGLYRRDYSRSHSTGLRDALIAATADIKQAVLVTLNRKHFPMLAAVHVPYTKT